MARTPTATQRGDGAAAPSLLPGLVLGLGLGGLLDGILLHQILPWHHMGPYPAVHGTFRITTVRSLADNTLWV